MQSRTWEHAHSIAEVARRMGNTSVSVSRYFHNPSVQTAIVWKAGLAIGHNFFAELANAFPVPPPSDEASMTALAAKDQRIADLEKELAIYKEIVLSGRR